MGLHWIEWLRRYLVQGLIVTMVQMGGPEAKGPETFYYCHAYSVTYDSKTMYSADLFIFLD